jgi:hypothetical protein
MKITSLNFPEKSILFPGHEKYDYCDSFGGTFSDPENKIRIEDILNGFAKPLPGWIDSLMSLRDKIVSLFGLKTSEKERQNNLRVPFRFIEGEKMGFFNFYNRTDNEIILGEDNKHLNFRVSLLLETPSQHSDKKRAVISTVVTYNNRFGSLYFYFVKPFHRVIVPAMMKKNYNHLNN